MRESRAHPGGFRAAWEKRLCWMLRALVGAESILAISTAVYAQGQGTPVQRITDAVERAMDEGVSDPDSETVRGFLSASDTYDGMDERERSQIPKETREDLERLRQELGKVIRTCDGVTVEDAREDQWYIRTNVRDAANSREVIEALKGLECQGESDPELIWHRDILDCQHFFRQLF